MGFINVGYGNVVNDGKILAIISPDSAPAKRLIQNAKDEARLIDATQGRRTRAVIVTDTGHIVLSAIQPETIASRTKAYTSAGITGEENE